MSKDSWTKLSVLLNSNSINLYCTSTFLSFYFFRLVYMNFIFLFLLKNMYFSTKNILIVFYKSFYKIHPPILYLSFLFFILKIQLQYDSLVNFKFIFILQLIALITGAIWAYYSVIWGYTWNNDVIELLILLVTILLLCYCHSLIKYKRHNTHKLILTCFFLFIMVRFNFIFTKHSFFKLQTKSIKQYIIFFWFLNYNLEKKNKKRIVNLTNHYYIVCILILNFKSNLFFCLYFLLISNILLNYTNQQMINIRMYKFIHSVIFTFITIFVLYFYYKLKYLSYFFLNKSPLFNIYKLTINNTAQLLAANNLTNFFFTKLQQPFKFHNIFVYNVLFYSKILV